MSGKALALVFINLGGEMLYVLDQRLYAQKIQIDKGKKIMQDIVTNMFSDTFLEEIFRSQEMCSRKALRTIYERLAHTSIMRLNESSMDKLFDLMTMAVKYQMSLITKPKEMLLVTLNHLDSIIPFVSDSNLCMQLIDQCYKRLYKTYLNMNDHELQFVRHTILNFFQDLKIKVSVFLKEKVQNWNGTFVLFNEGSVAHGCEIPGTINYYEADGRTIFKQSKYLPGAKYLTAEMEGSYEKLGDRITKLGLNVYSSNKPVDTIIPSEKINNTFTNTVSDFESNIPDPRSKAQLDLLCKLIGKSSQKNSNPNDFKLNLFNNEEEEFIYKTNIQSNNFDDDHENLISFDASKRQRDERLYKVMNQFSANKYDDDDADSINFSRSKGSKQTSKQISSKHRNYDDDDDDIVSMMDRMNKK